MAVSQMWVLLGVIISICYQLSTQDTLLFVATPGDGSTAAGLYGALVSNDKGMLHQDTTYDFKFGYHCSQSNGVIEHDLPLKSVSYDSVSGRVLLQKEEDTHDDLITLYEGDVCQNGGGCNRNKKAAHVQFEKVRFPYKKPKAFGYHDRKIYFIMQETRSTGADESHNVIELRRFVGCRDQYPVTVHTRFELDRCSEKLATLIDERRKQPLFSPMSGLRVTLIDDELYAFVVLEELILHQGQITDLAVNVYAINIRLHEDDNKPLLLHRETIGHANYRRYIIKQLGNVDYKEDKLCWSAFDRVQCADFFPPRQHLRRIRYIVSPGRARDTVCKGEEVYANITTGVTIAEVVHDDVSLFFGCIVNGKGLGGLGFARMRHWESADERLPVVRSVGNVSSAVPSGQMFLSHKCKYVKYSEPDSPHRHAYDLQNDQGSDYTQGSHSAAPTWRAGWISAVLICCRTILLRII